MRYTTAWGEQRLIMVVLNKQSSVLLVHVAKSLVAPPAGWSCTTIDSSFHDCDISALTPHNPQQRSIIKPLHQVPDVNCWVKHQSNMSNERWE